MPMMPARKRGGHGPDSVSVAELVEREANHGHPLRLNWPAQCLDALGTVRDWQGDEWPTGELPVCTPELPTQLGAQQGNSNNGRNQRTHLAQPASAKVPATRRYQWRPDSAMLERLLNGLRNL